MARIRSRSETRFCKNFSKSRRSAPQDLKLKVAKFFRSESGFRSRDLWVMSPTRFRCANSLGRHAPVAQLAARGSHNPKVAGSIPVESIVLVSLGGQDTRLSPERPGFNSRSGNFFILDPIDIH